MTISPRETSTTETLPSRFGRDICNLLSGTVCYHKRLTTKEGYDMDLSAKIGLAIGGIGLAALTGAAIQHGIDSRERRDDERREEHRQLEQEVYDLKREINGVKSNLELEKLNLRRQIDILDQRTVTKKTE